MSTAAPSPLRQPERQVFEKQVVGLPPLREYLRNAWDRREFAVELSRTKLRSQHFDTAFGQLWLVLNPLLLAGVYFVLVDILRSGEHPKGFFAHLVIGIFAYYYISGAMRDGVKSVTGGSRLILNQSFPRVLLPLSSVITAWKRFVPTLLIYVPVHVLSGLPITFGLLWVVPIFVLMTLMAAGFTMLTAAIQVYFRDLSSFLPYLLRIGLYASPVLYFASDVPHGYEWLLYVNPFGQVLAAWGDVLHTGTAPPAVSLAVGAAWSIGILIVGSLVFMSRERDFAVRL